MMFGRKQKWTYTQEEIDCQIQQIKDLMQLRKASQIIEEIKKFDAAVIVSQEVLGFMLDENVGRIKI